MAITFVMEKEESPAPTNYNPMLVAQEGRDLVKSANIPLIFPNSDGIRPALEDSPNFEFSRN